MRTAFDRRTEGERERELMRAVRSGTLDAAELEARALPFPVKIQIQTASPCNAACTMCPWPETASTQPQGFMDEGLFEDLVAQIAGRGVERTSLFLMNEPLIDKRLPRLVETLHAADPETRSVVFTNGLLLDGARARKLAEAGLDEIDVSVIGYDSETYSRHMKGLDFGRVTANLEEVGRLSADGELGSMRVQVVGLELPGVAAGADAYRERTGLPLYLKPCTNRAGNIEADRLRALGAEHEDGEHFSACQRPFVKAYVLYNGDAVLCNCDWRRTTVLGNVGREGLEAIWRGPLLSAIRRQHLVGELPVGSLCAGCDYPWVGT